MAVTAAAMLDICRAHDLANQPIAKRWLIQDLWADQAVGIVGGEPKCCKSFLALDLAVSVASATPALRRFAVRQTGPVLLFAAEDSLHVVRRRLAGIAAAAGVSLASLDLHVITTPTVRLDLDADRKKLTATVDSLRPVLLVLDPFVRLHRIDENSSSEVAPLLAFLRELQRRFGCAVLLVHHAKKGAAHQRAGQALRGSSELHAWGDSNLYLRRDRDVLSLTTEHRAAPGQHGLGLELRESGDALALHIADPPPPDTAIASSVHDRIEYALSDAATPLSRKQLRAACKVRMATLADALAHLVAAGRIGKSDRGYRLIP